MTSDNTGNDKPNRCTIRRRPTGDRRARLLATLNAALYVAVVAAGIYLVLFHWPDR